MISKDFIAFAGKLAAQSSIGAAGYRTSISRAYYGAFHAASQFLNENFNWYCHNDNEHIWVQRHFQNCVSSQPNDVGQLLVHLHRSRKRADYDLEDAEIERQNNAMNCVVRAVKVESILAALSDSEALAQIRAEMEEYRRRANLL